MDVNEIAILKIKSLASYVKGIMRMVKLMRMHSFHRAMKSTICFNNIFVSAVISVKTLLDS